MPSITDPIYLKTQQYQNADNLQARIQLHAQFSTNQYDWARWVFDHLKLPPTGRILELGGGTGRLWQENLDRIPPGWRITLSDFSAGMLAQGWANLQPAGRSNLTFALVNAQHIPWPDESCDAVIANHMLYHVPDRDQAYREIRRVLKPGGKLYAATNGRDHMRELYDLIAQVIPPPAHDTSLANPSDRLQFRLENGGAQLAPYFTEVICHHYQDSLVVPEVEPLLAYSLSMRHIEPIVENIAPLIQLIEAEIQTHGAVRITKRTGLFVATK